MIRLLSLMFLLLLFSAPMRSQEVEFDNLTSITADSMTDVERITPLGPGIPFRPYWSADESTIYLETTASIWEYRLNDLEHPIFRHVLPDDAVSDETPHSASNPITSQNGRYSLQQKEYTDENHSIYFDVMDAENGDRIRTLETDGIRRTYSFSGFTPTFDENQLLYLHDNILYRWNPATGTEEHLLDAGALDLWLSPNRQYAALIRSIPFR